MKGSRPIWGLDTMSVYPAVMSVRAAAPSKMSMTELSEKVGVTMANLSILKNGHARAVRFSTLEKICEVLSCQPGDILEFQKEAE